MNHDDTVWDDPLRLEEAITRSRSLLGPAIDALTEVIHETTGRTPDRDRVRFVGSFWLMHLCDRIIHEGMSGADVDDPTPDRSAPGVRSLRSRVVPLVGSRRAHVGICEPYLKMSPFSETAAALGVRRTMRWMPPPQPEVPPVEPRNDRRRAIAARFRDGNDTTSRLVRRVALTAPVDLVELHHDLADWADSTADPGLRLLHTANAHQSSTPFRHLAFAQRRLGTILTIHQHGGGYGIDRRHLGEDHDAALADVFFSWGWTDDRDGVDVRPLPTAMPARERTTNSTDCLLMSLPVTSHFYRLQPFLLPRQVGRAVDETAAFVGDLAGGVRLRLRSSGSDAFPVERLSGVAATVSIDDLREPGTIAASRSGLVVHNYLGTSWLETLAIDVPTVCFFDPGSFAPRDTAKPFVDALARVGIIHHSGRDAASFVNSLEGNPGAWWNSAEVQEARRAFVARYANFSHDWRDAWVTEFERLLSR